MNSIKTQKFKEDNMSKNKFTILAVSTVFAMLFFSLATATWFDYSYTYRVRINTTRANVTDNIAYYIDSRGDEEFTDWTHYGLNVGGGGYMSVWNTSTFNESGYITQVSIWGKSNNADLTLNMKLFSDDDHDNVFTFENEIGNFNISYLSDKEKVTFNVTPPVWVENGWHLGVVTTSPLTGKDIYWKNKADEIYFYNTSFHNYNVNFTGLVGTTYILSTEIIFDINTTLDANDYIIWETGDGNISVRVEDIFLSTACNTSHITSVPEENIRVVWDEEDEDFYIYYNITGSIGNDIYQTWDGGGSTLSPTQVHAEEPESECLLVSITDETIQPQQPRYINDSADIVTFSANITTLSVDSGIYVANFSLVAPNGTFLFFGINGTQSGDTFTCPQTHTICCSGIYTWWVNASDTNGSNMSSQIPNEINITFGTSTANTTRTNPNSILIYAGDSITTNISIGHTGNSHSTAQFVLGDNVSNTSEINISINPKSVSLANNTVVSSIQINVSTKSLGDGTHIGYVFWNRSIKSNDGNDEESGGSIQIVTAINFFYNNFDIYGMNNGNMKRDSWNKLSGGVNTDVYLNETEGIDGSNCLFLEDNNNADGVNLKYINFPSPNDISAKLWARMNTSHNFGLTLYESDRAKSVGSVLMVDGVIRYTNCYCENHTVRSQPILQNYSLGDWAGLGISFSNETQNASIWINNGSIEEWVEVVSDACSCLLSANIDQVLLTTGDSSQGLVYVDDFNISFYNITVPSKPSINNEYTSPVLPRYNDTVSLKANITDPNDEGITDALFSLFYPNGTAVFSAVNGTQSGDIFTSQPYKICGNGSHFWYVNATNVDAKTSGSASYNEINITFGTMFVLSPDADTDYGIALNAGEFEIFNITNSHTGNSNSSIEFFLSENITNSTGVNTIISSTFLEIENGTALNILVNISSRYNAGEGTYVGYLFWNRTTYNESCDAVIDRGSVKFSIAIAQYIGDINITVETFDIEKIPDETYIQLWHLQNDGNYKAGDCDMSFTSSINPVVSFNETNFTLGIGGTASILMTLVEGITDVDNSAVVSITCHDISNTTTGTDTDTATGIFKNVGGSPGSSGGGGTTHQVPEFTELIVSPGTVRIDAVQTTKKIVMKNDGTEDMNINLSASDSIKSIVSFDEKEFLLRSGETKEVSLVFSPSNLNYDGLIIVKAEGIGEKYVNVQVNQVEQPESLLMVLYDKFAEPFFVIPRWDIPIPKFFAGLALSVLALAIFFVKTPPRRRTTNRKVLMVILIIAIFLIVPFLLPAVVT